MTKEICNTPQWGEQNAAGVAKCSARRAVSRLDRLMGDLEKARRIQGFMVFFKIDSCLACVLQLHWLAVVAGVGPQLQT